MARRYKRVTQPFSYLTPLGSALPRPQSAPFGPLGGNQGGNLTGGPPPPATKTFGQWLSGLLGVPQSPVAPAQRYGSQRDFQINPSVNAQPRQPTAGSFYAHSTRPYSQAQEAMLGASGRGQGYGNVSSAQAALLASAGRGQANYGYGQPATQPTMGPRGQGYWTSNSFIGQDFGQTGYVTPSTPFTAGNASERASSVYDALVLAHTIQDSGGQLPSGMIPTVIPMGVMAEFSKSGYDPSLWTSLGFTFDPRIMGLSQSAPSSGGWKLGNPGAFQARSASGHAQDLRPGIGDNSGAGGMQIDKRKFLAKQINWNV